MQCQTSCTHAAGLELELGHSATSPQPQTPTLATWRGFLCSAPPWSRKPHGAPPDRLTTTSSATMLPVFTLALSLDSACLILSLPLFLSLPLSDPQCLLPILWSLTLSAWSNQVLWCTQLSDQTHVHPPTPCDWEREGGEPR